MQGLLLFVLPAGRSAEVSRPVARLICDRLWGQGIEPGAATAATRITEALHTHPAFHSKLQFNDRELTPLFDAAQIHPPTWADLLHASNLVALAPAHRKLLLATCENLLAKLAAHTEHAKVSRLVNDLERVRDQLRAIA